MAIVPITKDNFERFKVQTSPKRTLISSSNGLTGSIPVFGRTSPREKDAIPPADFSSAFDGSTIEQYRLYAVNKVQHETLNGASGSNIAGNVEVYLDAVNKAPQSAVKSKRVEVTRFEPSHKFTKDTMRKNVVKNVLFPRYRPLYKSCDWSYPNYHTLNFFTGSTVSEKSCLIYPCSTGSAQTSDKDNFPYTPGDTFTFEFWINPRYVTDLPTNGPGGGDRDPHYHAGTIMHLSSSYCISLVTGSSIDQDGYPDGFRIMFQLGHAAQTRPHSVNLYNADGTGSSTNPRFGATLKSNEKLFETRAASGGIEGFNASYTKGRGVIALSSDNSLQKNHWHHVAIRGGKTINSKTGSFYVDGKLAGTFPVCTSDYTGNLMPLEMSTDDGDPDALVVGNYLNTQDFPGNEPMLARFFNVNTAHREGLISMWRDRYDLVAEAAGEAAYSDPLAASNFGELTDVKADKIVANGTYSIISVGDTSFGQLGAPDGFGAGTIFTATKSGSSLTFDEKTSVDIGRVQKLAQFDFTNPLNAEIHELRIWKEYRSVENIVSGSQSSLTELSGSLMFYVPPWFTKETRKRDVLQTPFQSSRQKTDDPFNVALSFGVGGREINLPNFTRELVQGVSPRLYHLVCSENAGQTEFMSANELLYDAEYTTITGEPVGFRNGQDRGFTSIRKGNLTVLPNDNGLFRPNWSLLGKTDTTLGTHGIVPASGSIVYEGSPAVGQTIELTNTAGVTKKLVFRNDGGVTNGLVDAEGRYAVVRTGTPDTDYENLVTTIRMASVFGNDISGSLDKTNDILTLRQGVNGSAGNTAITHNLANATVSNFEGGEDDDKLSGTATDKFVDAFGTQNLGLISLEQMVSTGSIPEGLVDITSEFRGLPGIGASKAQAEITWTEDIAIEDKATIKLTSHNGKVVTYKFLNDTLIARANGTIDEDGSVIVDARTRVDSLDQGALGGTGNINDVWYRFMLAVNGFRKLVTAGSFKTGETYKIVSTSGTVFTAIGASNNNVGTDFVATGPGEGSGTALEKTDDTFILAFAPSMQGGASYDSFNPEMTSLILQQTIKGTAGNTTITRTGNWDESITVPASFSDGRDNPDASILNSLEGATPEDPGIAPGGILTILNRTRDPSSNEVVFFDASNLFYGNRIKPGSFVVKDTSITGSSGKVGITLRDNGEGGLYRDDCKTEVATWNEVGAIIYEEGISVIKTPNIPFFGKDQFEVTLEGEHNVHVLEINVPAPKGKVNSSSNPSFKNLVPSDYASETADKFVYITSINLHDENFNIVGRANLAQPVVKRDTDGYMFRLKMDY